MALPLNLAEIQQKLYKESSTSGQPGLVVIGPTGADLSSGNVASGATDSGNPIKVGGKYNATPITLTDGQRGDIQLDVNGYVKMTKATLDSGEDQVNDVQKVEQRFTGVVATADAAIKSGAGFVHTITFAQGDAAPTAGSIIIYDNTAESGTILLTITWTTAVFYPTTIILDQSFGTGLYLGFTTTADISVNVSYR